ncbi:hypothetical protein T492DRAFT_908320, partial [Pavlovales sp. CCMP2436]
MDPSVLLAGLQRMDDEGVMFQVELLEQLCSVLAMSESRDMLAVFEPSQFVPALGAIMGRESHVFPETPVLACRAVKHFISLDPRLSRVAVRANLGTLCLSALALSAGGDGATEEAGDLAECAIKVLEMLCKREGRQVARGVPGGAHVAVGQLLGFIEVCDAIYPPDVTESALMALRGVLSSCPASETHAHEAAPVLCRLIGDTDRPKLQYAALQGMASLTSVLSIARETAALELIAADVSSELIGALGAPRASPAALSLELLVLWRLCSASPAVLHGCLKRGLAGALAGLLRESCTGASPSKGVEASATELLRFASALASLLGAVTPAAGPGGRRAEEYLPQSSYAANAEGDADAAELLREAIKRDDLASVCALIDLGGQPVVDALDQCEQSMLMWAVHAASAEVVEALASHASAVDFMAASISTGSALHFAAYFGRPDAVRVLLRHGANARLRNRRGRTPAEEAALQAPPPLPADGGAPAAAAPADAAAPPTPVSTAPPAAAARGGHANSGKHAEALALLAAHAPAADAGAPSADDAWRSGEAAQWRRGEAPALLRALLPSLLTAYQGGTPRLQPRVLQLLASLLEGAGAETLPAALGNAPIPGDGGGGAAGARADAEAEGVAQQLYALVAELLNARESACATVAVLRVVAVLVVSGGPTVVADLRVSLVLDAAAHLLRRKRLAARAASSPSSPWLPLSPGLPLSFADGARNDSPPPMVLGGLPPMSLPRVGDCGAGGPSASAYAQRQQAQAPPTQLLVSGLGGPQTPTRKAPAGITTASSPPPTGAASP